MAFRHGAAYGRVVKRRKEVSLLRFADYMPGVGREVIFLPDAFDRNSLCAGVPPDSLKPYGQV
jgi:hypothetical protein